MTGPCGSLAARAHTQHVPGLPSPRPAVPLNHCPEHRLLVTDKTLLSKDQCSLRDGGGTSEQTDQRLAPQCVCKAAARSLTNTQLSPVLASWVHS